jgi:hypothetical protein
MRKCLFMLSALFIEQITFAQVNTAYKAFTLDAGFGAAVEPKGSSGFLIYLEPGYSFAERFKPGVRLEQTVSNMKYTSSSLLTFDYYLNHRPGVRVFAGGGYGFYNTGDHGGCELGPYIPQSTRTSKKTGSMLRAGFEFNHLRVGVEYNFAPATEVTTPATSDKVASTVAYQNAYWGLKASVIFGGGKKRIVPAGQ